jgi:predicted TIM-barrel fold metal-dependent hydrolase
LPRGLRELAAGEFGQKLPVSPSGISFGSPYGGQRLDSYPADGSAPGADYEMMRDQLLDGCNVERALLGFNTGRNNALTNPYLAQAVVRAMNDWNLDTWLSVDDDRLWSVVVIPGQLVDEAVAEIHRIGDQPRIVSGLIGWNSFGKPLGHPVYHPIYDALCDHGLTLNIHIGAGEYSTKGGAQMTAGGAPSTYFDFHVLFPQTLMHHLASMLVHGVFEKFPTLKLVCIEGGIAWLPWLVSQLDSNYSVLRRESALLRRLPSEYLRDHVRLTTQPLEASPKPEQLVQVLQSVDHVDELLCFSTDYPHWDADTPSYIARRLPEAWQENVMYGNAYRSFDWDRARVPEPV